MKIFIVCALLCAGVCSAQDSSDRWYTAIRNDDRAEIQKLIRSAGPETKDARGTTPLMFAAAVGSLDAMKTLVNAGADVNAKNAFDITALMWCATDEAKVRLLLSKGADANARSKQGRTPLLIAAGTEGSTSTVKLLLEKGAKLKDAAADPVATPLTAAVTANDTATVQLLLEKGADTHEPAGGFALIIAAGHGNTAMARMLLAHGVPIDTVSPPVTEKVKNGDIAIGLLTPLIMAAANGGPDMVKMLLDGKANVNAQDVRGMTPLMLAVALDHPDVRVVRLLLERGADPKIKSKTGETVADWARKFNNPEILKALNVEPVAQPVALKASVNTSPLSAREAAAKSIALLQQSTDKFFVEGGCSSCHAHNLTAMAIGAGRKAGFREVDEAAAKVRLQQTTAYWSALPQTLLLRMDVPGGHQMTAFGAFEFAAENVKPSLMTDAMAVNIAAQQQTAGNWHNDGIARPPITDGDFSETAFGLRALKVYGAPGRKAEFDARIAKAAQWLRSARPLTAEDRNMQLLGLAWAGADRESLKPLVRAIVANQKADGGWAQTPFLGGDAYATGQTLVAMKEAGVDPSDPVYRKGVDFLVRTQSPDGSWHVVSRAPKFQPYFQSGFPHDHDQWISMSGTAWAAMALAPAAGNTASVASAAR